MIKRLICYSISIVCILLLTSFNDREIPSRVKWMSIEEALVKLKNEKRPIMIDVYTDWCGWCKVMDKNTFQDKDIASLLNERFYPVKLDGEYKGSITVDGSTYKFIETSRNGGYHELAAILLNNELSYPSVVFLNDQLQVITRVQGFQKPKDFSKIVNYIATNAYKTTSWKDYLNQ